MKIGLLSSVSGVTLLAVMNPVMAGEFFSGVAQVTAGAGTTEQSSIRKPTMSKQRGFGR
jgi:hypothetical protein